MNKETANTYEIIPELRKRWSPRAFSNKEIEKEKLQSLFEAARWAPSSSNQQPWSFIIGFKGDSTYAKIMDSLVEFNQLWTKTAPVMVVSIAKESSSKGGINISASYDVGQSIAHLSTQATAMDLYIHQMTGLDFEKLSHDFEIPADYKIQSAFTIGYPGDPKQLHENLEKLEYQERQRKGFDEFVFSGTFGQKSDLF